MLKKPEILSPAGNFEKLISAVRFGADAVYLAGKNFGMRAASDNFSDDELLKAVEYLHERGKKLYLTVNVMPKGAEYTSLREFLTYVGSIGVDGIIAADLGVIETIRELLPEMPIHVSTQASICSPEAARAYVKLGASRLVLARELTLPEIAAIRAAIPENIELEAFVHGSMCVSYSGRCMLSNQLTGRDANHGACAQPCRWNYTLIEEQRPDLPIPVEEERRGTFIMSSKDMCTIKIVPELIEAGINSFKIEGRVKSAYYTAVVTNAYRMAVDAYCADPEHYKFDEKLMRELESVSHREYCEGFYRESPEENAQLCRESGYISDKAFLAVCEADAKAGEMCKFRQKNKAVVGDAVEIVSPGFTGKRFVLDEIFDENGEAIESTPHPSMIFYVRTPYDVTVGDILRGE